MQLPLQAVRPCQKLARPRGGDVTAKRKNTSTNQKPKEKRKWHMTKNSLTTRMAHWKGVRYFE